MVNPQPSLLIIVLHWPNLFLRDRWGMWGDLHLAPDLVLALCKLANCMTTCLQIPSSLQTFLKLHLRCRPPASWSSFLRYPSLKCQIPSHWLHHYSKLWGKIHTLRTPFFFLLSVPTLSSELASASTLSVLWLQPWSLNSPLFQHNPEDVPLWLHAMIQALLQTWKAP